MKYIYPQLRKEYKKYINNTNKNALREFQLSVDELSSIPEKDLTSRQREFLFCYHKRMPEADGNCVMNRICRRFEAEFDHCLRKHKSDHTFDYSIMKCGTEYTQRAYAAISRLYKEYSGRVSSYSVFAYQERIDAFESVYELKFMEDDFRRRCIEACPDKYVLCDIILDICYKKNATKKFAWSMCGDTIIENLLKRNGNIISYPVIDDDGDFEYDGNTFRMKQTEVVELGDYT